MFCRSFLFFLFFFFFHQYSTTACNEDTENRKRNVSQLWGLLARSSGASIKKLHVTLLKSCVYQFRQARYNLTDLFILEEDKQKR